MTDPRRRGSQAFAHDLDAALRERGRSSAVVALSGTGEMDFPVLGPGRLHPSTLRELRRRAAGAGVVIAHGSTTLDACGIALAGTGTPFVYVNIGDPRHWARDSLRRARVGLLLRRAAAIASVSPTGREILLQTYRLAPGRVRAIPNGRRPERFRPPDSTDRSKARAELGLPTGATVLVVVGALAVEKRVALAIEAFARLVEAASERVEVAAKPPEVTSEPAEPRTSEPTEPPTSEPVAPPTSDRAELTTTERAEPPTSERAETPTSGPTELPDYHLLVAGEGPERAALEALAARRAPGRVTFTGNLADLGPVYRAGDVLVLSSTSEGVPGVLVEAGMTAIPAAATDVGFVRDVVVDGVTGALAEVGPGAGDPAPLVAAIRRVLADREAMGRAARAHCLERHAMETVVDAWTALLDEHTR
ncbi:glycosyltransferase family 4 protein [Embleya hyalina]|uniref:glycosyltransferase family 4 protein n=1 Tax=Embleya hyalina TaxID=516124 RepID=UPI001359D195|nr:glycosyltransferase family 4 protein [Embleya hyalina]